MPESLQYQKRKKNQTLYTLSSVPNDQRFDTEVSPILREPTFPIIGNFKHKKMFGPKKRFSQPLEDINCSFSQLQLVPNEKILFFFNFLKVRRGRKDNKELQAIVKREQDRTR